MGAFEIAMTFGNDQPYTLGYGYEKVNDSRDIPDFPKSCLRTIFGRNIQDPDQRRHCIFRAYIFTERYDRNNTGCSICAIKYAGCRNDGITFG